MKAAVNQIHSDKIRCTLSGTGASIVSVQVKNWKGQWIDVAMSPESIGKGTSDPSLAGRTIAPCCGRVRDGIIRIDRREYQLALNDGSNHIHGGPHGAAWQVWKEETVCETSCCFSLSLPDGLDGYPGNRVLTAEYQVIDNALQVRYSAVTDRITWLDMTNHVYWDLNGKFDGSALRQTVEIAADQVAVNDESHLITTLVPVKGAFDFSTPGIPERMLSAFPADRQIRIARGYNHAYVLKEKRSYAARLFSRESGIRMTMYTDQPAIVFYSGGFLGKETKLKGGFASPGCALALEAQGIPDPFHAEKGQATFLSPNQKYQKSIRWEFDT